MILRPSAFLLGLLLALTWAERSAPFKALR